MTVWFLVCFLLFSLTWKEFWSCQNNNNNNCDFFIIFCRYASFPSIVIHGYQRRSRIQRRLALEKVVSFLSKLLSTTFKMNHWFYFASYDWCCFFGLLMSFSILLLLNLFSTLWRSWSRTYFCLLFFNCGFCLFKL